MEEQAPIFPEEKEPIKEELGLPMTIVSFCIPLVGVIIYFQNKDVNKGKAKTACYAALGGIAFLILTRILTMGMK